VKPPKRPQALRRLRDGHAACSYSGVGGEDQIAHGVLCVLVGDGPEQREAAAFAVDGVLPGGERDVATGACAALPDGEANQLESGEDAVDEVERSSTSASFPGGLPLSFGMIFTTVFCGRRRMRSCS